MKRLLLTLSLSVAVNLCLLAETVQIDGIWYRLDEESKTAIVMFKDCPAIKMICYYEYHMSWYDFWDYQDLDNPRIIKKGIGGYIGYLSDSTLIKEFEGIEYPFGSYKGKIKIPSHFNYNGSKYTVTTIGDYAFYDCAELESVHLPFTITTICNHAFSGCVNLKKIKLPKSLRTIGKEAFRSCKSLVSISVSKDVTYVGRDAFQNCRCQKSEIEDGIRYYGTYLVEIVDTLEHYRVREGTKWLSNRAFDYLGDVKSISFPAEIQDIPFHMWGARLDSIFVDEKHHKYSTVDGVLFDKDTSMLLLYPDNRKDEEYHIPEGVQRIQNPCSSPWLQRIF